jgi:hypothetical protein
MGIEQNTHNPHFGWNNPVRTTQLLQIARLSSKRDYFRMARHPLAISQPPRIGLLERAFSRT